MAKKSLRRISRVNPNIAEEKPPIWGAPFEVEPILTANLEIPSDKLFNDLPFEDQTTLRRFVVEHLNLPIHEDQFDRYKIAFALQKEQISPEDRKLRNRIVDHVFYFSKKRIRSTDISDEERPPRFSRMAERIIESLKKGKDSRKGYPLYINGKAIAKFVNAVIRYVDKRVSVSADVEDWSRFKFDWITSVVNWRIALDLGKILPSGEVAMSKRDVRAIIQKDRKR